MPRFGSLLLAAVAALAIGAGAGLSLAAEPGPPPPPDEPPALVAVNFDEASFAYRAYRDIGDDPPPPAPAPAPSSPAGTTATWLVLGWAILTMLVNTLFHAFTPRDVDAWAERNPGLAWIAALFRRAGIEPIAILTLLAQFFATSPPPPAAISGNVAMGKRRGFATLTSLCVTAGVALLLCACGVFRGADAPGDAKDLAQCEARVAEENPEASFADFVKASLASCLTQGIRTVADVVAWIAGSDDPHAARYKPAARETQADGTKMGALRAQVGHP